MGLNTSSMIRLLVRSFVEEYDRADGHLTFPPRWQEEAAPARRLAHVAESSARYATGRRKSR